MTALASLPPITAQKTAVPSAPPGAAPSLSRFLDLLAPDVGVALSDTEARQEPATPGKPLPDDREDGAIDPSLLFVAPVIMVNATKSPSPLGEGLGWGLSTSTSVADQRLPLEASPPALATQSNLDRVALDLADGGLKALKTSLAISPADSPHPNPSPEGEGLGWASSTNPSSATTALIEAKTVAQTNTTTPTLSTTTPADQTAARVFAQAIHRAVSSEDPRPIRLADPLATAVPTGTDLAPHAVTASADAQHAALDMAQRDWPGAMIARIETLREAAADAADAADTRIRLMPDALGTIDVSLRTEGETVHVHFAAEQAQTRALLADAHARLTELADARGLKLSQSGVDAGGSGQQQRAPQPSHATPDAPRSAEPTDITEDHRIA